MDSLAHGLYAAAVFKKRRKMFWWVILIGMMPDILVISYDMLWSHRVYPLLQNLFALSYVMPPSYLLYYITHSFITAGIVFVILWFVRKELSVLAFPLALHVLFDIPFHCGVFATRFLYPLSDIRFCGYEYTDINHAWLWVVNYIVIGVLYYILRKREKENNRKKLLLKK